MKKFSKMFLDIDGTIDGLFTRGYNYKDDVKNNFFAQVKSFEDFFGAVSSVVLVTAGNQAYGELGFECLKKSFEGAGLHGRLDCFLSGKMNKGAMISSYVDSCRNKLDGAKVPIVVYAGDSDGDLDMIVPQMQSRVFSESPFAFIPTSSIVSSHVLLQNGPLKKNFEIERCSNGFRPQNFEALGQGLEIITKNIERINS